MGVSEAALGGEMAQSPELVEKKHQQGEWTLMVEERRSKMNS